MIGSIVVEVAAATIAAVVIGTAALVGRLYRGQIEVRAELREIRLLLATATQETADLQGSLSECQRNCRVRTEIYVRTETRQADLDLRVARLERLADAEGA